MSFISNLVVLECGRELFVLLNVTDEFHIQLSCVGVLECGGELFVLLNVTDEFHIQLSCVGVWERVICVVKCH